MVRINTHYCFTLGWTSEPDSQPDMPNGGPPVVCHEEGAVVVVRLECGSSKSGAHVYTELPLASV